MSVFHYLPQAISLIGALFGFVSIVVIHELGHFFFAKFFGVKVPTFSVGMGPVLAKKKIGGTDFCISLLPLGGYVEIAGLAESGGQGSQTHAQEEGVTSFRSKPYWQKSLILLGGIFANILLGFTIHTYLHFKGHPIQHIQSARLTSISCDKAGARAGLIEGDQIVGIDKVALSQSTLTAQQFIARLREKESVSLTIKRGEETITKLVTLDYDEEDKAYRLNASMILSSTPAKSPGADLITSLKQGFNSTYSDLTGFINGLTNMVRHRNLSGAGGPVMIMAQSFQAASQGIDILLLVMALISIGLAVSNLIPLGVLDGGQLLFATIEAILGRSLSPQVKQSIDIGSLLLFLTLFVYLTYQDILALIA